MPWYIVPYGWRQRVMSRIWSPSRRSNRSTPSSVGMAAPGGSSIGFSGTGRRDSSRASYSVSETGRTIVQLVSSVRRSPERGCSTRVSAV